MASEKMTYWLAVGIMAILFGNHFMSKVDSSCLRQRALYAVERISGSANGLADHAQAMMDRDSASYARVQSRVACAQSRIAYAQSVMARKEAALAQAQAIRDQHLRIMDEVRNSARCPRQKLQIVVPEVPSRISEDAI